MATSTIMYKPSIVEQGTSGTWSYRKWSDGTAECWGSTGSISPNFNSNYGNAFYAPAQPNQNYPTGLFISKPTLTLTVHSPDGVWVGISASTNVGFAYYPYCSMGGTHTFSYCAYAIGKWK